MLTWTSLFTNVLTISSSCNRVKSASLPIATQIILAVPSVSDSRWTRLYTVVRPSRRRYSGTQAYIHVESDLKDPWQRRVRTMLQNRSARRLSESEKMLTSTALSAREMGERFNSKARSPVPCSRCGIRRARLGAVVRRQECKTTTLLHTPMSICPVAPRFLLTEVTAWSGRP